MLGKAFVCVCGGEGSLGLLGNIREVCAPGRLVTGWEGVDLRFEKGA